MLFFCWSKGEGQDFRKDNTPKKPQLPPPSPQPPNKNVPSLSPHCSQAARQSELRDDAELLDIPEEYKGQVIGRGKKNLNEISRTTGAHLFIKERNVYAAGPEETKEKARREVGRIVMVWWSRWSVVILERWEASESRTYRLRGKTCYWCTAFLEYRSSRIPRQMIVGTRRKCSISRRNSKGLWLDRIGRTWARSAREQEPTCL